MASDPWNAFVPGDRVTRTGAPAGPLHGLTFAVKDVFDLAGHTTGAGSPDWHRTHAPAAADASAVARLLAAGADLVGRTICDELTYGLDGSNAHYGTPVNPAARGRLPGGSSSGSAVAVAAGLVDFGLGTDTGGSVRIPAAYCGLAGLRPTHGRVAGDGVFPLAPSFDTVGWMAGDGDLLATVGEVVLAGVAGGTAASGGALLVAADAFALSDPDVAGALASFPAEIATRLGLPRRDLTLARESLAEWALCFQTLQGQEAGAQHHAWLTAARPALGPGVRERFDRACRLRNADVSEAKAQRRHIAQSLAALLADGSLLCLPTAPGAAPPSDLSAATSNALRARILALTSIAGLAGLPQLTLPLRRGAEPPLAISLVAAAGGDERLLAAARILAPHGPAPLAP